MKVAIGFPFLPLVNSPGANFTNKSSICGFWCETVAAGCTFCTVKHGGSSTFCLLKFEMHLLLLNELTCACSVLLLHCTFLYIYVHACRKKVNHLVMTLRLDQARVLSFLAAGKHLLLNRCSHGALTAWDLTPALECVSVCVCVGRLGGSKRERQAHSHGWVHILILACAQKGTLLSIMFLTHDLFAEMHS